jgi:hypothetical protein
VADNQLLPAQPTPIAKESAGWAIVWKINCEEHASRAVMNWAPSFTAHVRRGPCGAQAFTSIPVPCRSATKALVNALRAALVTE